MSGQVEVKKHSCRQDRDGQWIVSFEFHPDDIYNDLVLAKKNTVFNLTYELAESDGARDNVPPVSPTPEKPVLPAGSAPSDVPFGHRGPTDGERMRTRAVMLCKDRAFKEWLTLNPYEPDRHARNTLAQQVGLNSLADLPGNPEAQKRFLLLEAQYHAERRGG
jgi:hypothetical protein